MRKVPIIIFLILSVSASAAWAQDPTPSPTATPVPLPTPFIPDAPLPAEPPPIAPTFEAPVRPLPSSERVGVDLANQLSLSLEEAIELALRNNNDIDTSRNDVQIAEFNFRGARGI